MNRFNYIVHVQRIKYTLAGPSTAPIPLALSIAFSEKKTLTHASESSVTVASFTLFYSTAFAFTLNENCETYTKLFLALQLTQFR